jgi:hypothetical protein
MLRATIGNPVGIKARPGKEETDFPRDKREAFPPKRSCSNNKMTDEHMIQLS